MALKPRAPCPCVLSGPSDDLSVFVWGSHTPGVSTPASPPSTAAFVPPFHIGLLNYLKYILSLRKGPNKVFLNSWNRFFPQKGSVLGLSTRKIVCLKIG